MNTLLPDLMRSFVTTAMLTLLLFTLAQPRYGKKINLAALTSIIVINFAANFYFYLRNDYTALARFDIIFFVLVSIVAKPLFNETIMQWLFNCLTVMNVYGVVVILSYYLCALFPYPYYSITALRLILFISAILVFHKRLRSLYRQAAEHWSIYLLVAGGIFLNFAWYFISDDDVQVMLAHNFVPLLLLILLSVLVYLSVFFSMAKTLRETSLREENIKMQTDRELTRQRLKLMDESVRQMSVVQHDQRHLNAALLELMKNGETEKAAALIKQQTAVLPQKPVRYCDNVAVNAAVSYYTSMAVGRGIRCELRLDIPENLHCSDLSLSMVVSNLMENAIHACEVLDPQRERYISLNAVYTGQLILSVENPYSGTVTLNENGYPISTQANHGMGSESIREFVEGSGGEIFYSTANGVFSVKLLV